MWNRGLLRLHAWPDRWVWLDARCPTKKGWAWSWTYEGRLLGEHSASAIIKTIEDTLGPLHRMDSSKTDEFSTLWKPLLARGPVEVP